MQHVGKPETAFNRRLSSLQIFSGVQEQEHNLNNHAKFIIIGKLVNLHDSKEALREILAVRENFWIQKLKSLVSFRLNQELSK